MLGKAVYAHESGGYQSHLKMRDDTASGRVLGPRIFVAGPMLDDAPGDRPFRLRAKTA